MRRDSGFVYLGLLFAVAFLGLELAAASEVWVRTAERQRMEQLQWRGQQYVQAIGRYYESSSTANKAYPRKLDGLLEDHRFPFPRRHLRRAYENPFSSTGDWEPVLAPDGGIRGVAAKIPADVHETGNTRREYVYEPLVR